MKKVIASILVCGFAIAFLACGNDKAKQEAAAAKAKADSTRRADSVKMVNDAAAAKEKAAADSTRKADSLAAATKKK